MKKMLICLTSICLALTLSFVSVYAQDVNNNEPKEIVITNDEYTMLLEEARQYETKSRSVLAMSEEEESRYIAVKNAIENYPNFIYEQQKLSDEELRAQYYTDEQIAAIRAFDGDESLIPMAAASVSATLTATEFNYNSSSNRTYLAVRLTGSWSGTPAIRSQDTVAIQLGGTTSNYMEVSSSGRVTFDNGKVLTNLNSLGQTNGRIFKFGMQYNGSTMRSFQFTFRGFGDGRMTGSSYAAVYAHYTLSLSSPSYGVDFTGKSITGYGISFGIKSGFTVMFQSFKTLSSYI